MASNSDGTIAPGDPSPDVEPGKSRETCKVNTESLTQSRNWLCLKYCGVHGFH